MVHQLRRGFTLVELLVVIGIIALLVGILIPVVSKVRANAYVADTRNWLSQLSGAIDHYYSDFHAYPGPLSYMEVHDARSSIPVTETISVASTASAAGFDPTFNQRLISGSENLVLGLLGGLKPNSAGGFFYDPAQVGLGPMVLNTASRNVKRYPPYLDAQNLSWQTVALGKTGHYFDDATLGSNPSAPSGAMDTIIPEFMDRFPQAMPILYLKSRVGVDALKPNAASPSWGATYNSVITDDPTLSNNRAGPYDLSQIIGYTGPNADGNYIGTGREVKVADYVPKLTTSPPLPHGLRTVTTSGSGGSSLDKSDAANYQYPYDAFAYFLNPNFKGLVQDTTNFPITPLYPRQKDAYILIAPGRDRTYGTSDDICNFGDVNP